KPGGATNLKNPTEGVCLTKSLIVQRNMPVPVEKEDPETISEALTSLQVLRLDRERISCIANLPELKHVHSIYLQQVTYSATFFATECSTIFERQYSFFFSWHLKHEPSLWVCTTSCIPAPCEKSDRTYIGWE
uniref:Uncharacterized protein n=1 Tax=Naja naja TaxID=35670 RepID=A0A8C6XFF6_NAJNA